MRQHVRGLLVLVVPTMAIGWFVVGGAWNPLSTSLYERYCSRISLGFMLLLFPSLNFISCLAISACLTPTDPVISAAIVGKRFPALLSRKNVEELDCSTVVGGKYAHQHVPINLRQIIAADSAANDGLAYPFLSISIYLTIEASRREAFAKWFLVGWLCKCSSLLTVRFELTLSRS
jgi:NhaP-type Na+/H+ or K+/H+ antiporter